MAAQQSSTIHPVGKSKTQSSLVITVPRTEFFDIWVQHSKETRYKELLSCVVLKYDLSEAAEYSIKSLSLQISAYSSKLDQKWNTSGRHKGRFLNKNSEWLSGTDFTFTITVDSKLPSDQPTTSSGNPGPGRRMKDFVSCSEKTKRRRVDDLLQSRSPGELLYAAEVSTRMSGNRNVANIIKKSQETTQISGKKTICEPDARCLSNVEALAYYVDSKSTTHGYKTTRKWSIKAGHKVYPSFYSLRKAKEEFYPNEIDVGETRAEIKVQSILDKTIERLVLANQEVFVSLLPTKLTYTLISKWGCDGSSGHSTYKQKFTCSSDTDEVLFIFSFVPLQLQDEKGNIVWQNLRPSSTMYCRPIKFIFSKETKDFIIFETNKVLEEINALLPTKYMLEEYEVSVNHNMLLTMIDGKVCNALTESS
ncbi:uncharacterized protein [Eurosta solidaginis]|uniref:uncharacterized protein n=1 Tax=Eurosta solidaginis TaxID=178769 RepID=UPI00353173C3